MPWGETALRGFVPLKKQTWLSFFFPAQGKEWCMVIKGVFSFCAYVCDWGVKRTLVCKVSLSLSLSVLLLLTLDEEKNMRLFFSSAPVTDRS